MSHVIEATGLAKTFVKPRSIREIITHPLRRATRIEALRGVDLDVSEGEILGLLGPNGAGKTTLLKIFSCLVLPDTGHARIGGTDTVDENVVKRKIGLVHSDERSFYWRLSARENLRFFARLCDVPFRSTEARITELLERVDLIEAADRPFSGYSSGMKQRVSIARALLHDPPILLMDEPTRSLDPAASRSLREFIVEQLNRAEGKTIVLATHDLREAEAISHRVAILIRGQVREIGSVDKVRRWGLSERLFRLEMEPFDGTFVGPFRFVEDETRDGVRHATVALEDAASLDDLLRTLVGAGVRVRLCDRIEPDLEQAFTKILEAEPAGP